MRFVISGNRSRPLGQERKTLAETVGAQGFPTALVTTDAILGDSPAPF
ncbi:MAG: hypothetical protein WCY82_07395 [Desulfotomaculaceae bacterium]